MRKEDHCTKEMEASAKAAGEMRRRTVMLWSDIMMKEKDTNKAKMMFAEEAAKISGDLIHSSENVALRRCALEKCPQSVMASVRVLADALDDDCVEEGDTVVCEASEKFKTLARKKHITMKEYTLMTEWMLRYAMSMQGRGGDKFKAAKQHKN